MQFPPAELAALDAAEAWVREPEENFRRAALAVGNQNNGALPAVWMALAAAGPVAASCLPNTARCKPPISDRTRRSHWDIDRDVPHPARRYISFDKAVHRQRDATCQRLEDSVQLLLRGRCGVRQFL